MIERAVILAAGRGVRMGPRGRGIPKGFIEVGGEPLILRSLKLLAAAGIGRVQIVTGHLAEQFETLPTVAGLEVRLVHNAFFAEKGSFESLRVGLSQAEAPVLLLESDIIYEPRALSAVLDSEEGDLILTSGPTGAGDEVYVWADAAPQGLRFRGMSKVKSTHADEPHGELVGISKLSPALATKLLRDAAEIGPEGDYESALVRAAGEIPIGVIRVTDLLWGEIDDEAMLSNVETRLWPALQRTS